MVRGVLTQHVMEAVSQEMFGGDQGRELVSTDAAADPGVDDDAGRIRSGCSSSMLGSVQKFYGQQRPAGGAAAAPSRAHHAVHRAAKKR